jgi:2-keto-3-deoxy-L-rhamnonate aldolase RhmA
MSGGSRLRAMLSDRFCLGVFVSISAPELVEMLIYAGFDFVIIDAEHGALSDGEIRDMVRASDGAGAPSLVRLAADELARGATLLDAGASGLQLTGIGSKTETEESVRGLRYPPRGHRGFSGYTRAARYGLTPRDALLQNQPIIAAQVETIDGLAHVDETSAIPELDMVFFGPVDFSISSLALPADRRVLGDEARRMVREAAHRNGKLCGTHARSIADVELLIAEGFNYATLGFANLTAHYWASLASQARQWSVRTNG